MPKAYSYLRFSTPEQSKGDSFRRQTAASRAYAKRHGLELDETLTFEDKGVSAFRGKNVKGGELGAFLNAVESGKIRRGSYLLVENLDRLSRDTVRSAFIQFTGILERGVNVVTLTDGKLYTAAKMDADFGDLLISLTIMFRAHDESALKSKRISASWKNKRDKAQNEGEKLTARCPAWLTKAGNSFMVDKARAKVVRRIFDMTIAGHGKSIIARLFNLEGIPTFGKSKGWHPSYIQKILENKSVIGTFQPMRIEMNEDRTKTRVPVSDPIPEYFPAIIDRAVFERARRARASRRIPTGRTGENFSNLFSGLAVCECGAPMQFVNKGKGSKGGAYLVCSYARRSVSNCKAPSWKYGSVEALLILCLEKVNYSELFPDITRDTHTKLQELEDSKLKTESELSQIKKRLENIVDALEQNSKQPALMARLNATQAISDKLAMTVAALATQIEEEGERAKSAEHDFKQIQDGLERLDTAHKKPGSNLYDLRSRLHQLLKRTVRGITFHPAAGASFASEYAGDLKGKIEVRFESTKIARTLYMEKNMRACHSVPIRSGKADFRKAVTLRIST
ncbi:MAG TPA: recombinase family protein [Rhizomicrobium sp.]